jgi:hypothetical protein
MDDSCQSAQNEGSSSEQQLSFKIYMWSSNKKKMLGAHGLHM